ncbi:hypothetical protein CLV72_109405 [Allonocardiopsis opalescens]|uniref:Uncharacterized protein n=2 Tax=Allonocardiopsis opalescens TaxID=1144618 RepID=A0A2T0PW85_9ACTN|nr:hypothetical protein CLV72_109405 [Allonocardiopsis opalescens]
MESAAVARGSARFDMSGSLGGAGLASVTGGYVFHSAEEIDFTTTVEFRDGGTTRTARAVGLGNAVYLRPPTRDGMPPGTEWIRRARSDWEDPPEVTPVYNEAIRSINGIRDWSMIAAAAELVPVGTRTVDGERTTGYRARFEVLAAMRTEGVVGASFRVLQDLYAQGARTVGFIVWVDGGYLPRSVLVSVPTDEGRLMAELNFHGWGEPVAPEAPPDELVWRRS